MRVTKKEIIELANRAEFFAVHSHLGTVAAAWRAIKDDSVHIVEDIVAVLEVRKLNKTQGKVKHRLKKSKRDDRRKRNQTR